MLLTMSGTAQFFEALVRQPVKGLASKPDNLSLNPEPTW